MHRLFFSLSLILTLSATSFAVEVKRETSPKTLREMSLRELLDIKVTTPSRSEETRDLAPGSIYVFDAEMIRRRGYRSLADLLRAVPGFTVFHKGLNLVVGVRGLNANDNEKITLLINGRESNNSQEPDFLNGPINLQTLERVEVVVGPSSFFQRANTLAATVNIITRKVDGVELSIGGGTDTPYSANVLMGKRWSSDRYVTASLTLERKDGIDAWDANYKPALAGFAETEQLNASYFGVLEGQIDDTWAQFIVYDSRHPELGLNGLLNPDGSRIYDGIYLDQMFLFNLKHHLDVSDALSVDLLFDAGYKKVARFNGPGFVIGRGRELEYPQFDYSGEIALEYKGVENHFIYGGVQTSYEDNLRNVNLQNGTAYTLISPENNSHAVGVYFYDRWQVTPQFKAEGGLRFDYNSLLSDHAYNWGGRLAFAYEIIGRESTWITKLILNRAVRYPSAIAALNEAWGSDKPPGPTNPFTTSLPASKAEILSTIEWQNIFYWKETRLSINLYYQDLSDFISFFRPHTNVGDFNGYGLEFEIEKRLSDKVSLWANASLVESELETDVVGSGSVNDEGRIIGAPSLTVTAGFDAEVTENLTLSGQVRYFTDQAAFKRPENIFEPVDHQAYVDLTATYVDFLVKNLDLGISMQNLLNNRDHISTQWQPNQYRPRGRSFFVELRKLF